MRSQTLKVLHFFFFSFFISISVAQTLTNYINEAKKNYTPSLSISTTIPQNNATHLKFGYFINPQYTISGAQRAYAEIQQEIPWVGKGNSYRKFQKSKSNQIKLEKQYKIEQLGFTIKEHYYKMYQYQKQKDIYVLWSEKLRTFITATKKDSISTDLALKQFEYEAKLLEITKQLQIVDGNYQNEVIIFNELLKNENLEEPNLPLLLAMPEEESEFQFPDPFESAAYKNFENKVTQQKYNAAFLNPWAPNISLGLKYINVSSTDNINFGLPTQDIFQPQLQFKWNLFSKKATKTTKSQIDKLLDQKLLTLTHQLQIAINEQISARIAYDASSQKIENLQKLERKLTSNQFEITSEKKLQINSLKYTFEIEQVKAVVDYYISTSKMLLFF